jgi:hypothetical protein
MNYHGFTPHNSILTLFEDKNFIVIFEITAINENKLLSQ